MTPVTTTETSHSLLPLFKEFILTIQSYFGYVPDRRLQYFAVTIVKYLMEIYRDKQRLGANYLDLVYEAELLDMSKG